MKSNSLSIPNYFLFSQFSLSTFENCPLKFKKRYFENLKWDITTNTSAKEQLELGRKFHLIAQRYFMGIDTELSEHEKEIQEWTNNLKTNFNINPEYLYLPEYKLRMSSSTLKLEANFDLLLIKGESIEIWDWKTHAKEDESKKKITKQLFEESLQTIVYMFVLKEQGHLIFGKSIPCERISMHYWQPSPPKVVAEVQYSQKLHENFKHILESKIARINQFDYNTFDKTIYKKHCKYCEFNWFCNNESVDFESVQAVIDEFDNSDT